MFSTLLVSPTASVQSARKNVSLFGTVLPIDRRCHTTITTLHPNKGNPVAMLGHTASGPGVSQSRRVARCRSA